MSLCCSNSQSLFIIQHLWSATFLRNENWKLWIPSTFQPAFAVRQGDSYETSSFMQFQKLDGNFSASLKRILLVIWLHLRSDSDPILLKYGVDKSTQLIWHAEFANKIIPEECEMRAGEREFVLKKKDPIQWNSGLLHCTSANAVSTSRPASIARPYAPFGYIHWLRTRLNSSKDNYM